MSQFDEKMLIELGQKAADAVAGVGVAKRVEVAVGPDSNRSRCLLLLFLDRLGQNAP